MLEANKPASVRTATYKRPRQIPRGQAARVPYSID